MTNVNEPKESEDAGTESKLIEMKGAAEPNGKTLAFTENEKQETTLLNPHQDENSKIAAQYDLLDLNSIQIYERHPTLLRQMLIASGPLFLNMAKGLVAGYSATMLPQLKSKDSTLKISINQESWIASAIIPTMAVGCVIGGFLSERFGRKTAHTWSIVPLALSWLIIGFAESVELLIFGRLLTGFLIAISSPASMTYIGETTSPKYRGFLAASLVFGMSMGIMLVHIYGPLVTWQMTAHISAIFTVFSILPFWILPESPSWLVRKGRYTEAEKSMYWCKGKSKETYEEFIKLVKSQTTNSNNNFNADKLWDNLCKPEFYKPFLIINLYSVTAQWSGYNVIQFYTVAVAKKTIGESVNEYVFVIILDLVRVVMSVISCFLIKILGTRKSTFISGFGSCACLCGLTLSTYYSTEINSTVLPFVLVLAVIFFVSIGYIPVPWNLMGELFPLNVRSFGASSTSSFAFLMAFSTVITGPYMFEYLGQVITYLVYCVICLVGTSALYFVLPETKGKTLLEVEEGFRGKIWRRA